MMMTTNLPSGYHRDLQLLKEHVFPAFSELNHCIEMAILMIENMEVKKDLLKDPKYKFLFSVEEVNKLVNEGMPFRDAYKKIGLAIEANNFTFSTDLNHQHEGSIGNLCNPQIAAQMELIINGFGVERVAQRIQDLLAN
jgi:argininosuccinate lyase